MFLDTQSWDKLTMLRYSIFKCIVLHLQQVQLLLILHKQIKSSTTSSTTVKNTSHEVSGQISSLNEPQENKHPFDGVSIEQAYFC